VVRYLGGTPLGREETWRRILATSGAWSVLGYGYWAVERKEGGGMIGHVGFADFKRDIYASIEGFPEAGWVFARHAQGQGLASEAVAAALSWGDQKLGGAFVAIISPENAASIRLAQSMGFVRGEDTTYKGDAIVIFRRPAA
jgi:RimJ/RimL family protein N-acetyltransferase